jgi:hypothetical protein
MKLVERRAFKALLGLGVCGREIGCVGEGVVEGDWGYGTGRKREERKASGRVVGWLGGILGWVVCSRLSP